MSNEDGKSSAPPQIAYRTFINLLDKFVAGVPNRIDSSFLKRNYSGTIASQVVRGLRFLGLIEGDDNRVTADLKRLAREKEAREQLIREMIQTRYAPVFEDVGDLSGATHGQLEQAFRQHYKIDGESRRKAISFFVHAAKENGIPLSPFIRTADNPGSYRTGTKRPRQASSDSAKSSSASANGAKRPQPSTKDTSSEEESEHESTSKTGHEKADTDITSTGEYAIMYGVLKKLPFATKKWTQAEREKWLRAVAAVVDMLFELEDPHTEGETEEALFHS